jgi:hypothetical protein
VNVEESGGRSNRSMKTRIQGLTQFGPMKERSQHWSNFYDTNWTAPRGASALLDYLFDPDTLIACRTERHVSLKPFPVVLIQEGIERNDPECPIILQERPEEIVLVIHPPLEDPLPRIFEREEDCELGSQFTQSLLNRR